jgi:hypothetical protein
MVTMNPSKKPEPKGPKTARECWAIAYWLIVIGLTVRYGNTPRQIVSGILFAFAIVYVTSAWYRGDDEVKARERAEEERKKKP